MSPPKHATSLVALTLLLALATGCAPRPIELRAETVASAGGASFWVAGTEGFAALAGAQGTLERHDYPLTPGAPDYAYEPFMLPAATPLVVDGQTFLFTRIGDVLLWDTGAWSRVPVNLIQAGQDHAQIDVALLAPDGRIVIQLHGETLLWATPSELRRGVTHVEKTPNYFTWLGFVDGSLHGIGWTSGGNRRAIHRRDAEGRWSPIGMLPPKEMLRGDSALLRLPGGTLAVASMGGLYLQTPTGFDDHHPIDLLLHNHATIAGPSPDAPELPGPSSAPITTVAPIITAAPIIEPPRAAPPAQVASSAPPTPAETARHYLRRVLILDGRAPLLVLDGERLGLLDMAPTRPLFIPCAKAAFVMGAVTLPTGLRLITTDAELLDLRPDGCMPVAPPLLGTGAIPGSPPAR